MGWKVDSPDLAGDIWDEVRAVCAKPISRLTPEDLYHLLIHQVAPSAVVPRALDFLEDAPLISSGRFPGDLLKTLLDLPESYWAVHHDHWMRTHGVLHSIEKGLKFIERPKAAFLAFIGVTK
jgi:hypothetical protein